MRAEELASLEREGWQSHLTNCAVSIGDSHRMQAFRSGSCGSGRGFGQQFERHRRANQTSGQKQ